MQRLFHRDSVPETLRGGVIALGNFDGFHRGHQAVVGRAVHHAHDDRLPVIVATFDPHPVRHFQPDAPPFRLTTLDQREELFAEAGADAMMVFEFGAELAGTSAEDFIEDILLARFGVAGVVTGNDFVFGKGRKGDVVMLAEYAKTHGFFTEIAAPVNEGEEIVSSSRIREALKAGDCETAAHLLTRPFAIEGVVEHGAKNGRKLGYPTANIPLGSYIRPRYGIYAVRGRLPDGRTLNGAANLGIRPSFDPPTELLEPYFFDFDGNLYGQTIAVELVSFIRAEAKFDDLDALKAQMAEDCAEAERRLTRHVL
ncbi:bifunctional riboflavin kinase/FAD synthetase [Parasphingopyxis algicola]|uniref:bifunctional riboflavin kinase/FAD synthetase n=1 Tax=Parasphingopyxis algicola TaxID=2026624 RepID=UPI0015A3FE8C|nr:bifunctional riboflavin kinase/FAD synthetase [Parasphingopyxis algicola]QLC26594.1 bifunctional riboflavin kinase/FAD synthetase [Parasphingopyxis algicola]